MLNRIFGRLEICRFRVPLLLKVKDTPSSVEGEDKLYLSIMLRGNGCFKQSRRTVIQGKYEIVLCEARHRFVHDFTSEAILVKIPSSLLSSRHAEVKSLSFPLKLAGDPSLNILLANLLGGAMSVKLTRGSSSVVGARVALSILDLISAIIDSEIERNRAIESRNQAKLASAQRYVLANLGDEGLSPEDIANHISVSLRTLNRLFAQAGTTPMRWVWQRRLEAGHSMLAGGGSTNVADVAAQFGFSEVSHFSRSFKAAYGSTPAQVVKSRPGYANDRRRSLPGHQ